MLTHDACSRGISKVPCILLSKANSEVDTKLPNIFNLSSDVEFEGPVKLPALSICIT